MDSLQRAVHSRQAHPPKLRDVKRHVAPTSRVRGADGSTPGAGPVVQSPWTLLEAVVLTRTTRKPIGQRWNLRAQMRVRQRAWTMLFVRTWGMLGVMAGAPTGFEFTVRGERVRYATAVAWQRRYGSRRRSSCWPTLTAATLSM